LGGGKGGLLKLAAPYFSPQLVSTSRKRGQKSCEPKEKWLDEADGVLCHKTPQNATKLHKTTQDTTNATKLHKIPPKAT
jgi:hypothetical protein